MLDFRLAADRSTESSNYKRRNPTGTLTCKHGTVHEFCLFNDRFKTTQAEDMQMRNLVGVTKQRDKSKQQIDEKREKIRCERFY
ncbi:unnamed protein product [Toxocara canis]|uniref:Uncharacterized protein n=1 Tax=Toxocara canis TaxID=6265 RepID=A0A183UWK7_TOXCA|nr:unnamed protein product [Toxocara canis]